MMNVGNLQVNTLNTNLMESEEIIATSINGVTAEQFSYLNGVKDNVKKQLDDLNQDSITLKNLWKI